MIPCRLSQTIVGDAGHPGTVGLRHHEDRLSHAPRIGLKAVPIRAARISIVALDSVHMPSVSQSIPPMEVLDQAARIAERDLE